MFDLSQCITLNVNFTFLCSDYTEPIIDESEDFNDSMGDPLETTMSENQVNPESTDEVQVLLSCSDCGERKEKIEKLQKIRSKLNRRIACLKKENENLRKVAYRDLNLPHYSRTARNRFTEIFCTSL